jgi:hypothetical protein
MTTVSEHVESQKPALDEAREGQGRAIHELEQALALLVPPEQQQQQQDPQQGEQDEQQEASPQQEPEPGNEGMDPAQLLQAVRDREAERRRERAGRQTAPYETVEQDW